MSLSPLDVAKHEFTRVMRGYDPAEVRAFLERIGDELSDLQAQQSSLVEQLRNAEAKLETYLNLEKNMRDSLLSAQEVAKSSREQSEAEREQTLKEARLAGEEIKLAAERDVLAVKEELRSLVLHRDAYIKRLRFLLRSHSELLDLLEEETPAPKV